MIEEKVHSPIASKQYGIYMSFHGIDDAVFSVDAVNQVFSANQFETDFKFNFHFPGGFTAEGSSIYDLLQTGEDILNWGFISKVNSYNTRFMLAI